LNRYFVTAVSRAQPCSDNSKRTGAAIEAHYRFSPAQLRYRLRRVVSRSVLPRERFRRVLGMFSSLEVKVLYPT
jgi:hypothetical protein